MRILSEINYVGGLGADRWIGEGFMDAFETLGHEHFWLEAGNNLESRLKEVKPDILMTSQGRVRKNDLPALASFRKNGGKVVLRVDAYFDSDPETADILINHDVADIYYGEVEDAWMERFRKTTGKKYVVIANAAHHKMRPGKPVPKYKCDIVFMGDAKVPKKKEILKVLVPPLRKKYDVKVFGPNWTLKDKILRIAGFLFRKAGLESGKNFIQKIRMTVPPEDEPALYSSAKICINIHSRTEDIKDHVILNERTFKIAACGGFEICDFVPPLRKYFSEDEMVMACPSAKSGDAARAEDKNGDWVKDWFEKIDYYLKHDDERRAIQDRGTKRALRDHTYINRVRQLFDLLGIK